jgi:eukaryotic-like serine/threonine-protein kinase
MPGFDTTYKAIADAPPGDAASAQRALATDGTEVIVKTVTPTDARAFTAQLARLVTVLDPHLERVLAWEQRGESVAVATEPVPGEDIGSLLAAPAPPPAAQVVSLGVETALGLGALHARGLVHGGVKPAVMMRDPRAGVVLVDAGLAQAAGGADLTLSSPAQAATCISPEEAMARPLVPASDVYSLGVVLYWLATGRPPFEGHSAEEVAAAHMNAPLTPPRRLRPDIPVALEDVIMRCLEKDPDSRYTDGHELVQALRGELEATRIMPAPAPPPPPRRRSVWPWVLAGVIAVVALIAVLWATGVFATKVTVPDVAGMSLAKATTKLDGAGLKAGAVSYQQATGKAQGTVLSQSPAAGASVKKGSAVAMVAVGKSLQVVPDVAGMTQAAAATALSQVGLQLGNVSGGYSSSAPDGTVTGQAPAAGLKVESGSAVAVTVSKGPKPAASPAAVAVPDVTGQTKDKAVSTLTGAGFTVVLEQVSSSTVPAGEVIGQTPSGGVLAQPGSAVTVAVSSGAPTPAASSSP